MEKECEFRVRFFGRPIVERKMSNGSYSTVTLSPSSFRAEVLLYWLLINKVKRDFRSLSSTDNAMSRETIREWFYSTKLTIKEASPNVTSVIMGVRKMLGSEHLIDQELSEGVVYYLDDARIRIVGDIVDLLDVHRNGYLRKAPFNTGQFEIVERVLRDLGKGFLAGADIWEASASFTAWLETERDWWDEKVRELSWPYVTYLTIHNQTSRAASEIQRLIMPRAKYIPHPYTTAFLMLLRTTNGEDPALIWREYQRTYEFDEDNQTREDNDEEWTADGPQAPREVPHDDVMRQTYLALTKNRVRIDDMTQRLELLLNQQGGLTFDTHPRNWLEDLLRDLRIGLAPRLNRGAELVWQNAQSSAVRAGYSYCGTLFILEALLKNNDNSFQAISDRLGINREVLLKHVEALVREETQPQPVKSLARIPVTPGAWLLRESQTGSIGPDGLFKALVYQSDPLTRDLLTLMGIETDVLEHLSEEN